MKSDPTAVCIRPATCADLPQIVAMRDDLNDLELHGCPHASIQRLTVEQFTALWGASLEDARSCWRVVEVEGRPAGFGLIYLMTPPTDPPGAFLHWAYLQESARRTGVGRMLIEHLLAWAQAQGARRVELQFIEGNLPAQAFWSKIGFRPYSRKCVYYFE